MKWLKLNIRGVVNISYYCKKYQKKLSSKDISSHNCFAQKKNKEGYTIRRGKGFNSKKRCPNLVKL